MTGKSSEAITVRLKPEDYAVLAGVAKIKNRQVAELARELILEGLTLATDPDQIEAAIEAEKQRLLAAVAQMRKSQEKAGA
ncbi:hypothetical protein [Nocardia sp. NPDC059239]|uniref:hypothetical protein n=1 Tax=unclassified Nocardia TaxID=2637762 RepID=UPI0036C38F8E